MVCTLRQACKPPRAATFLATISSADNLGAVGELPGAALRDRANAVEIRSARVFRSIWSVLAGLKLTLNPDEYKSLRNLVLCSPSNWELRLHRSFHQEAVRVE